MGGIDAPGYGIKSVTLCDAATLHLVAARAASWGDGNDYTPDVMAAAPAIRSTSTHTLISFCMLAASCGADDWQ